MADGTCYRHILDTIECSTIGWEDKPPRLPKLAVPLDWHEYNAEEPPPPAPYGFGKGRTIADMIVDAITELATPEMPWVTRVSIYNKLHQANDRSIGEHLTALVRKGMVERSHARGGRMCYRVAGSSAKIAAPPQDALRDKCKDILTGDWVENTAIAQRLRMDASATSKRCNRLMAEGYAERRQGQTSSGWEYRASRKLLTERMRAR